MKKFIIMLMLVLFAFVPCVYSEESKCLDLLQPYVVEPVQADFTKFYWLSFSSPCRALQFFETLKCSEKMVTIITKPFQVPQGPSQPKRIEDVTMYYVLFKVKRVEVNYD